MPQVGICIIQMTRRRADAVTRLINYLNEAMKQQTVFNKIQTKNKVIFDKIQSIIDVKLHKIQRI